MIIMVVTTMMITPNNASPYNLISNDNKKLDNNLLQHAI